MPQKYILDTCIFNALDGTIRLSDISSTGVFVATHVQIDELSATRNRIRRDQLRAKYEQVGPHVVQTESFCFDVSRFDQARWSSGELFKKLKTWLDAKNKKKRNNVQDILIAEIAVVEGFTLVTSDADLAEVAKAQGANVLWLDPQHRIPIPRDIELEANTAKT